MIRLLLKIFIAYWIAAGIVIFISDFEPHMHIHNPELMDALDMAMAMHGRTMVEAYESGHCDEVQRRFSDAHDGLYLATPDGRMLCGDSGLKDAGRVIRFATAHNGRTISNYEWLQLIAVPVSSPRGGKYVLLFKNGYTSILHFGGLLPGKTTVAISCIVTLLLGVLLALPIRQLRKAAGQIAMGKLDARVPEGSAFARSVPLSGGDDIEQLVRDFNFMADRIESLAKAQRLLLRDLSHELRTPLTRLGVALGLARSAPSGSTQKHLDRIESETMRVNELIGQILSLSQMDLVHEIETPRVLSLSALVTDLLPDLQYEAAQNDCSIDASIGESCYVSADEGLLRAAVENVMRNAIKYASASGTIRVLTTMESVSGEPFSIVQVSDRGPGIPEHELKSVLDPFYRADKVRHRQKTGSGLGLAIADRAVRLHHGTLGLRNNPDGGLIVEICLPSAEPTSQTP